MSFFLLGFSFIRSLLLCILSVESSRGECSCEFYKFTMVLGSSV